MHGCRALSNADPEVDELDDLLLAKDQPIHDLALDRERRRDEQGYVTPAQARAFLEMSRQLALEGDKIPSFNPIAHAHLRRLDESAEAANVLLDIGITSPQPRALLVGSLDDSSTLRLIQTQLQFVLNHDPTAYARRSNELRFVANTIIAGCGIQGRAFTAQEGWDAAIATCNLGLENWPLHWISVKSLPDDFLLDHDLVTIFQVGLTILHKDVALYSAANS